MTTFTDATPMVTVHADHHNELAAAVDNLQGLVGNSVLSGTWRWTSSTTDASASGRVGLDQVTWATATQLNLNETTLAGGDTANVLAKLKVGDGFYLQDHTDASRWARYTISGTPVDQGTWRQFPVTFVDGSGPPPANNSDTVVTLTVVGGNSAALDTKVDKDSVTAAATRVVQNMFAAGDANPAWQVLGSGQMQWGAGGASAPDVTLSRGAAGRLHLGSTTQKGSLRAYGGLAADTIMEGLVTTDAQLRFYLRTDGQMRWGDGTATQDVAVLRGGPGLLWIGASNIKGAVRLFGAAAADQLIDHRVTTDAQSRFYIRADGYLAWGDGTAAQDTFLSRNGVGSLSLSGGQLQLGNLYASANILLTGGSSAIVARSVTGGSWWAVVRRSTDAVDRLTIDSDGKFQWGDGTAAVDTILQRSAADRLFTPDHFAATTMGLATKVKAGTPVDADWTVAPPDGTIVADSTGNKLWVRVGGVWKGATIA